MSDTPVVPTAVEAFGAAPLPSATDAFPLPPAPRHYDPLSGSDMDEYFSQGSVGHTLNLMGQGAKQGWGATPVGLDEKTEKFLRSIGIFNDYETNRTSLIKSFNEALIRPAAAAADLLFQRLPGVVHGIAVETPGLGPLAAAMEAFPAGHATGFPARIPAQIARAADLGVIGKGEAGWRGTAEQIETDQAARQALAPTDERVPRPVSAEPFGPVEPTPVEPAGPPATAAPDLHAIARQLAPDTFAEYDALAARRDALSTQLDDWRELRRNGSSPEVAAIDAQIAAAERAGLTTGALRGARARAMRAVLEGTGATAEMEALQQRVLEADYRMRDLAPEVSATYRKAAQGVRAEEAPAVPVAEAPAAEAAPVPTPEAPPQTLAPTPLEAAAERPVATPAAAPELPIEPPPAAPAAPAETADAAPAIEAAAPRPVEPIPGGIAGDVSRQLVAAGRPLEEAEAAATLVQAHYNARAANLGTTAEDLYRVDAPRVRAGQRQPAMEMAQPATELEQSRRGSIRLATDDARATITLFKDADASTFIHETGHQWLEELVKDAGDERATDAVRADVETVRNWLGVEEGQEIPRKAHEKFARGFERYMMEGHAPTRALADVFAKFKDWLTTIYQAVAKLRSPINDDIRGVFDRMLATPGEDPVIAPAAPPREFITPMRSGAFEKVPREPLPLTEFLRRLGGVQDQGGEISHVIGGKRFRPGLINGRGLSLDEATLRAWEDGYFPEMTERPTINDLVQAVQDEAQGIKRYSAKDEGAAAAYREALARNAEIDRLGQAAGIDPRNYTREEFFRAASEHMSLEEQARHIGSLDAAAELALDEAERRAKEFVEARGDAWEPDAIYGRGEAASLEDMENAYKSEAEALRNPAESPGGAGAPGPAAAGEGPVQGGVRQSGRGAGPTGRTGAGAGEAPAGPNERFGPADERLIDKAGNIRVDNLNIPEDVARSIRDAAEAGGGFIAARRGVLSDGEVLSLADALGMDPKSLSQRKLGEAFNAEEVIAARKLLIQSATNVRDAMARAAEGSDADVIAYGEAKARHMMIQEQVSGLTAEAGRALRAFRAMEGSRDAASLGEFLQQQTGRTLNQMRQEAQLGMKLDTPQQVSKFVHDSEKVTWKDYLVEAWINALLSGPLTHVKNVIGNTAVAIGSTVESGGAAVVGAARQVLPEASAERVRFSEVEARVFGLVQGAQDGLIAAGRALLDENTVTQGPHTIEQRRYQAIPSVKVHVGGIEMNLGGAQIRLPGRFLTAEDELFKAIAFRQEMNGLAYRQAASEGLTSDALASRVAQILQYPTDGMVDAARQHALYQTFQNPLGRTGQAIQAFANSHLLAKIVVPFVRTPLNILKYATERTPLGLLSREVRDNLAGTNGVIARDTQVARIALGSMAATAAIGLAAQGMITGGGPSDPQEKAALRLTGWQPYSIKIGDMYYSYGWLDPLGTIVGTAADITEITKAGVAKEAELDKLAAMFVGSLSKNIMSKASLRGASDLMQTLTDPDRYGPRYLQNLAGSLVPSVLGQIARSDDPVMRDARTVLDSIKSRIPGLRSGLLPSRDIWGEPIPNEGSLGPDLISPILQRRANADPVNRALVDLPYSPDKVERKIRGVELTPQQYDDYSRIAGRLAKMQLNSIVSPAFRQLPPAIQIDVIRGTLRQSREAAAAQIMVQSVGGDNDIMRKATDAKAAEIHGASPPHVRQMLKAH